MTTANSKTAKKSKAEPKTFRDYLDLNGYTIESFAKEAEEKSKTRVPYGTVASWCTGTEPSDIRKQTLGQHFKNCPQLQFSQQ